VAQLGWLAQLRLTGLARRAIGITGDVSCSLSGSGDNSNHASSWLRPLQRCHPSVC
jgi:hypothetical protein